MITCKAGSGKGGAAGASMLGTDVESWRESDDGEFSLAGRGTDVDIDRFPADYNHKVTFLRNITDNK